MPISLAERQAAFAVLAEAPEAARAIVTGYPERVRAIRENDQLSDSYKQQLLDRDKQQAAAEVERLEREIANARETLTAAARELSAPGGDTTAQLLAETRQARAWDRVRPLINNGRSWATVLADAEKARDEHVLLALASELPTHLQSSVTRSGFQIDDGLDLPTIRQAVEVAVARGLGDDKGQGTAARVRLHEAAAGSLAEAHLKYARSITEGVDPGMHSAVERKYAQMEMDRVNTLLDGDGDGDADGSDAA